MGWVRHFTPVRKGYTNLGRLRVAPLPQFIVMVDRGDGTEWVLSHAMHEGLIHVSIDSEGLERPAPLEDRRDFHYYGPYDGPYIGSNPRVRLLIRDGYLGYDYPELPSGVSDRDQQLVTTRKGVQKRSHEIVVPTTWRRFDDMLAFEEDNPLG